MPKLYPDPFMEATWNIAMAVAWISWRSEERVLGAWPTFRSQFPERYWRAGTGEIESHEADTVAGLRLLETVEWGLDDGFAPAKPLSVEDAIKALWGAMTDGKIAATAIDITTGRPLAIPRDDWPRYEPVEGSGSIDELRPKSASNKVVYRDVEIPSADIARLWPPMDSAAPASGQKERASDEALVPVDGPREISEAAIRKACDRAAGFMRDKSFPPLTRQEAERILCALYANSRAQIRGIVAKKIDAADKRRPRGQLMNRNNELEDCRRFLTSAT